MGLLVLVSGRYTTTYGGTDIGIAEDGYKLSFSYSKEIVTNTDAYGDSDVDAIYRGANMALEGLLKEYKSGSVRPVAPYNSYAATGATSFDMGVIGRIDTDIAATVVMTAVASTPAATLASPATLTAAEAIMDQNFNVEWFYGPRHRKTPFRFKLYPYNDTTIKWFACT